MEPGDGTTMSLDGLEPDNLLAFLALLGLLRALEGDQPAWQPRVWWESVPPAAKLDLACDASRADMVAATAKGIRRQGTSYGFDKRSLKYTAEEFRRLAMEARSDRDRAQLVAALASDGVLRRDAKGDLVQVTGLCALLRGQQTNFLERLDVAVARDVTDGGEIEREVERALFETWDYTDDSPGFRWEPAADRRHAYQFGDPSDDRYKIGTVTGANRLAAIGFAVLTCAPTHPGLETLGLVRSRLQLHVVWPLTAVPTGLAGHLALLAHPWLYDEDRCISLSAYGVLAVARARRYRAEYYNFERARLRFLDAQ